MRPTAPLEIAKAGGRAGPARVEQGLAAVRAVWVQVVADQAAADQAAADQAAADQADHPRPSGLSSMRWSLTPMAMASSTVVS